VTHKPAYEVGYGKPPRQHQWRKGASGNPHGRPSKKPAGPEKSFNPYLEAFCREMQRTMTLRENGEPITLSAFEAVVRSTVASALKGNVRAQKIIIETNKEAQAEWIRDAGMQANWVAQYVEEWPAKALMAARMGQPAPLPHPDHVGFSVERGVFEINGPIDRRQQAAWDELKSHLARIDMWIDEALSELEADPNDNNRQRELAELRCRMKKFEKWVPAGWNWREALETPSVARHASERSPAPGRPQLP
jgi:hypothetical protein